MSDKEKQPMVSEEELIETQEWLQSLEYVIKNSGPDRVQQLIQELENHAHGKGIRFKFTANTPYNNTISPGKEPMYPGDRDIERRIKSIIRWNAMAMVVRANRGEVGIGGHISTYASAATLYEVGFNHFFRGPDHECGGDVVFFQGHASPGMYSRAFLEGRLSDQNLINFRRELQKVNGLSSYPHPWLMPKFWQYPTVSMGLGPIMAIYHARYIRYLEDRGLKPKSNQKVWAFLGDGECDEPETLGAITLASRENLDNLNFVINCNLQRLDGPVRGNGKIIQELEAIFRGAGWNVIKVIWSHDWDPLLAKDEQGLLVQRMGEVVDGQYQKYTVSSGKYIRDHFFGRDERLLKIVEHLSDDQLKKLKRGGHDPSKIYAAYKAASDQTNAPTVILAKTVKGYGLGESGEGKNITHQQKKLNEEELKDFRDRFGIPISDDEIAATPFYKPTDDSDEMQYLHECRKKLGGYLPSRRDKSKVSFSTPSEDTFKEFYQGTDGRDVSTTMVFVKILTKLLKDKELGKYIVPIVPDEARTFGMEALFRQCGIYAHKGQLYEPVDSDSLLYYKEIKDGQILEEGINEAGAMSSFIAAGTSYSTHQVNTIPFFIYYSMFGFQRIGDLIWAAADSRTRGFLLGATAGRTTLAGEGLQHQDGHSHVMASTVPNIMAYDPSFAYEIAIIICDGIERMYEKQEDVFYYLTLGNENYPMPSMPIGAKDGILKGLYLFQPSLLEKSTHKAHLFGSGAIMNEVIKASRMLEVKYQVACDLWSVTSYKELRRDGLDVDRWNLLHPDQKKTTYIEDCLKGTDGVYIAASDYMKILPEGISKWFPKPLVSLGTDGFGRSEGRKDLRNFFEVDARFICLATLSALVKEGKMDSKVLGQAIQDFEIDPEKMNPMIS